MRLVAMVWDNDPASGLAGLVSMNVAADRVPLVRQNLLRKFGLKLSNS